MEIELKNRLLDFNDWAIALFVICFVIIAINRSVYYTRFIEFSRIAVSEKYLKIYRDTSNLSSSFTISLFFVQLVSFSFFILLFINQFTSNLKGEIISKNNFIVYIQIFTFLSIFILSKYLIEKIISIVFGIEDFMEQFNLQKVGYRVYFGVLLLPLVLILYYNPINSKILYITIAVILLFFNILTYFKIIRLFQNAMLRKIFYFILYLCTFEIAPYYFMYYWITKNLE